LDEVSSADLSRGKHSDAAVPAIEAGPVLSPTAQITGEVMSRVRNEIASRQRTESEKLPHSVAIVMAGLAVPGGLALAAAFGSLLLLGTDFVEDYGSEFLILVFVTGLLLAALDITTSALIYLRIPFSQPLGYVAGLVTLASGCGNPINFLCGILVLWFLSMSETADYLRQQGKPGEIDW
jgi:hypothetical protein